MKITPFANAGGYTTFDNAVLDRIMRQAAPNTWKVICAITRLTVGWQKTQDMISLSQLQDLTGIASRQTLMVAINDAIDNLFIVRAPHRNSFVYALNRNYTILIDEDPVQQVDVQQIPIPETAYVPATVEPEQKKERDERLDHKAVKIYRHLCRLNVPAALRDDVVSTVQEDDKSIHSWTMIVHDWIGYGWNKQNIKGMLDAYKSGGISAPKRVKGLPEPKKHQYVNLSQQRLQQEALTDGQ